MSWVLLGREIKGVIFDLDGVLCSTDEFHYLAWKATADSLGIPFTRDSNNRLRGVSRADSLEIILREYTGERLSEDEKLRLADEKNARYRNYLSSLTPADVSIEVMATLNTLRTRQLHLAVGSSSKNAPLILERLGITSLFDTVVDGNMIHNSKPDPEVFELAAHLLDLTPDNCLVVEDAQAGVQAAHAGGFLVACVGDAAAHLVGDINLATLSGILEL